MLTLKFKPNSKEFEDATDEYRKIWNEDGERILKTFEEVTGLKFKQKEIEVIVYEGPSLAGTKGGTMKLRANYPYEVKQGTLVHELGHWLIKPPQNRINGIDEHQTLNLFLYDVWTQLYGKEFADMMVSVESERKGIYDYKSAWDWRFNLDERERNDIWNQFLDLNGIKKQ